jgi:hypothetical protein
MARNWLDFVAGESRHCCLGNGLLLAVVADLILARVGMALAALLYIYRIAETTTVAPVTEENLRDGKAHALHDKEIPPNYAILRIHGPVRDDAKGGECYARPNQLGWHLPKAIGDASAHPLA